MKILLDMLKNLRDTLFGKRPDMRNSPARRHDARLQVEGLEDRFALSTVQLTASGVINIQGTSGNNKVVVSLKNDGNTVKVRADGQNYFFSVDAVNSIFFEGYSGKDKFKNKTSFDSTAYGGNGKDKLFGGSGDDSLYGGSGNDVLIGGGGSDWLYWD